MLVDEKTDSTGNKISLILLISIAVVSMGLLAFEIILTRFLSIMLSYHYVYGVTSIAMLGSGIGGFIIHYYGGKKEQANVRELCGKIVFQLSLISILMITSIIIVMQIRSITIDKFLIFVPLFSSPFLFGGMFFANLFKNYPVASGKLYFFDLSGAALGSALAFFSLNKLGDIESVILLSILISAISIILALRYKVGRSRFVSFIAALLIGALAFIHITNTEIFQIPIGTNDEKEIYDSLHIFNGEIIETRYSAFGRTDLIQYDSIQEHMDIYLDGTAGSPMYNFNGDINNPNKEVEELRRFPGYFPMEYFTDKQKESALIIGPGGGRDVIIALLGGVGNITAVEVNPDLVELVNDYSWYNGGIYSSFGNVNIIVDEGRSFLRSSVTDKFDIIMLTLPRTNTSRSVEGYALTENYLFTTDSISEYLNSINDDGHLVVVANDDTEILRLLILTLTVFNDMGVETKDAMGHIYILGSSPNPVFVLKNGIFESKNINKIYDDAINKLRYNPSTSFFPKLGNKNTNPLFPMLEDGRIDIEALTNMVKELGYDIRSVSDNNPFFYKLTYGLPKSIIYVLISTILLIIAMITVFLTMSSGNKTLAGSLNKVKTYNTADKIKYVTIFCMLGMGYMLIEISLIQKFVFFLGKPVLSLTVILFTVLLGSGIGSFIVNAIKYKRINTLKMVFLSSIAIIVMLIPYNYIIIPILFRYFMGLRFISRMIFSVLILLPLSMVMGMPFPLMIRVLHEQAHNNIIPWMWGINAISSVLGSVLAITIAISLGYNQVILLAAICYLLINISLRYIEQIE